MKKYFVVSDIHGFYSPMMAALKKNGFDINNPNHYLICLGDLLDRGGEAKKVINFFYNFPKDRLILIRGNHEDLFDSLVNNEYFDLNALSRHGLGDNTKGKSLFFTVFDDFRMLYPHIQNGTLDTLCQLGNNGRARTVDDIFLREDKGLISINYNNDYFKKFNELKSRMLDYYEIGDYIFVHGWIPLHITKTPNKPNEYSYFKEWRKVIKADWESARWLNGMDMASHGFIEPNKTIVCGHFHTGWGHYYLHQEGIDEFSNLDIYRDNGIIALDACTAYSHKVNCLVIELEEEE